MSKNVCVENSTPLGDRAEKTTGLMERINKLIFHYKKMSDSYNISFETFSEDSIFLYVNRKNEDTNYVSVAFVETLLDNERAYEYSVNSIDVRHGKIAIFIIDAKRRGS
jgi:hypothetical protein